MLFSFGLFLVAVSFILYALGPVCPPDMRHAKVRVDIPPDASASQIGQILKGAGLVKDDSFFVYYTLLTGLDKQLKAGVYILTPDMSLPKIAERIAAGSPSVIVFTVPEGYTLKQIIDLLCEKGLADADTLREVLVSAEFDYPFVRGLPEGPTRLEGYLYPDTYCVGSDISERELVDLMLGRFWEKIQELGYLQKVNEKGLTLHEAVTIASMIEREARLDRERPLIASVIFNRLRLGMPLQIDATVQYALGEHRPVVSYRDLEVDSPYNTYKVTGLPPGPIASPGEASLLAVVQPDETDYLYYVAKSDGSHAFARTLGEHYINVRKYQNLQLTGK